MLFSINIRNGSVEVIMTVKDMGRKKESKKGQIRCPICRKFITLSDCDSDNVGTIKYYYCSECGEEIMSELKVKK